MTADEQIGRAVLRLTVRCRPRQRRDERFPLTVGWVQEVSRKLGRPVGEHRAARIKKLLLRKNLIVESGSYRQRYDVRRPSGFRVTLYRLVKMDADPVVDEVSVRRSRPRRPRLRWWQHPLFGFGCKKYAETGLPKLFRGPPEVWQVG